MDVAGAQVLLSKIPLIQAENFSVGRGGTEPTAVVLHSMEGGEVPDSAENTALWMAGKTKAAAPMASAHLFVDSNSIVRGVLDRDRAYHAAGFNVQSIGIEHAGKAKQTTVEWMDPFSKAMLERSAELCAALCLVHQIPARYLTALDLRSKRWTGITTHNDVSVAFKKSTHTDPGPGFPLTWYVKRVADLCEGRK